MLFRFQDLYEAFQYYDEDNSGYITEDEILRILKRFHPEVHQDEAKRIIKSADKNGDGKISFDGKYF